MFDCLDGVKGDGASRTCREPSEMDWWPRLPRQERGTGSASRLHQQQQQQQPKQPKQPSQRRTTYPTMHALLQRRLSIPVTDSAPSPSLDIQWYSESDSSAGGDSAAPSQRRGFTMQSVASSSNVGVATGRTPMTESINGDRDSGVCGNPLMSSVGSGDMGHTFLNDLTCSASHIPGSPSLRGGMRARGGTGTGGAKHKRKYRHVGSLANASELRTPMSTLPGTGADSLKSATSAWRSLWSTTTLSTTAASGTTGVGLVGGALGGRTDWTSLTQSLSSDAAVGGGVSIVTGPTGSRPSSHTSRRSVRGNSRGLVRRTSMHGSVRSVSTSSVKSVTESLLGSISLSSSEGGSPRRHLVPLQIVAPAHERRAASLSSVLGNLPAGSRLKVPPPARHPPSPSACVHLCPPTPTTEDDRNSLCPRPPRTPQAQLSEIGSAAGGAGASACTSVVSSPTSAQGGGRRNSTSYAGSGGGGRRRSSWLLAPGHWPAPPAVGEGRPLRRSSFDTDVDDADAAPRSPARGRSCSSSMVGAPARSLVDGNAAAAAASVMQTQTTSAAPSPAGFCTLFGMMMQTTSVTESLRPMAATASPTRGDEEDAMDADMTATTTTATTTSSPLDTGSAVGSPTAGVDVEPLPMDLTFLRRVRSGSDRAAGGVLLRLWAFTACRASECDDYYVVAPARPRAAALPLTLPPLPLVRAYEQRLAVISRALTSSAFEVNEKFTARMPAAYSTANGGRGAALSYVTPDLAVGPMKALLYLSDVVAAPVRVLTLLEEPLPPILNERVTRHGAQHLAVCVADSYNGLLSRHLSACVEFFAEGCSRGEITYVHCVAGRNRSAGVTIALLMICYRMPLGAAALLVQAARDCSILTNDKFKWELLCLADMLETDAARGGGRG